MSDRPINGDRSKTKGTNFSVATTIAGHHRWPVEWSVESGVESGEEGKREAISNGLPDGSEKWV